MSEIMNRAPSLVASEIGPLIVPAHLGALERLVNHCEFMANDFALCPTTSEEWRLRAANLRSAIVELGDRRAEPGTKRAHDKATTRIHLLAVAQLMFAESGYEAVTMRDIAKSAGMSTGALFAHWTGKDELFAEAVGRPHLTDARGAELLAALKQAAPDQADALLKDWAA